MGLHLTGKNRKLSVGKLIGGLKIGYSMTNHRVQGTDWRHQQSSDQVWCWLDKVAAGNFHRQARSNPVCLIFRSVATPSPVGTVVKGFSEPATVRSSLGYLAV